MGPHLLAFSTGIAVTMPAAQEVRVQYSAVTTTETRLPEGIRPPSDVPVILEDGQPATVDHPDRHWLVTGNSCDLDRKLEDVRWTQLVPVMSLGTTTDLTLTQISAARNYTQSRSFFVPPWSAAVEQHVHVANLLRPVGVDKRALKGTVPKGIVLARVSRAAWILLNACLVRFSLATTGVTPERADAAAALKMWSSVDPSTGLSRRRSARGRVAECHCFVLRMQIDRLKALEGDLEPREARRLRRTEDGVRLSRSSGHSRRFGFRVAIDPTAAWPNRPEGILFQATRLGARPTEPRSCLTAGGEKEMKGRVRPQNSLVQRGSPCDRIRATNKALRTTRGLHWIRRRREDHDEAFTRLPGDWLSGAGNASVSLAIRP